MSVDRWNCTSYCLCESRKGHFEKASEDGVWVLYTDHQAEVTNLQELLRLTEPFMRHTDLGRSIREALPVEPQSAEHNETLPK